MVTVEEGTLEGGFGSALLEAANAAGLDTRHIVRLGLPDRFIEHAERGELLADLGLDVTASARRCVAPAAARACGRKGSRSNQISACGVAKPFGGAPLRRKRQQKRGHSSSRSLAPFFD